jgi:superfamily II RNA helicase
VKSIFQKEVKIQIVGMSATISNLPEIASFLNADVYTRDFRPVELKEYIKIGSEILLVDGNSKTIADAFKFERNFGDDYNSALRKRDPDHIEVTSSSREDFVVEEPAAGGAGTERSLRCRGKNLHRWTFQLLFLP